MSAPILTATIAGVVYPLDTPDEIATAQHALAVDGQVCHAPVFRSGERAHDAHDGDAILGGELYAGAWRGRGTASPVRVEVSP